MCDVEHNPKWTLHHIDELVDNVENNADEDDIRRMLKHDYRLTPDEEQSDYVEKRNRVFDTLVDFIKPFKERAIINHHAIVQIVKMKTNQILNRYVIKCLKKILSHFLVTMACREDLEQNKKTYQNRQKNGISDQIEVDLAKPEEGGISNFTLGKPGIEDVLHKELSMLQIKNSEDNICLVRAICLTKAHLHRDDDVEGIRYYRILRRIDNVPTRCAKHLHEQAGVPEARCGHPELEKFQQYLESYQQKVHHLVIEGRKFDAMILNDTKMGSLEARKITFKDSMAFPGSVRIHRHLWSHRVEKDFFPHKFHIPENRDYVGPLPEASYYDAEGMSGLENNTMLLKTKRRVYVITNRRMDATEADVFYRDFIDEPLETALYLPTALLEVELEKFTLDWDRDWSDEIPNNNDKKIQFNVTYDDEGETYTMSAEDIKFSTLSNDNPRDNVYFSQRKDLCELLVWVKESTHFNSETFKNGSNFNVKKRGHVFMEDLDTPSMYDRYWSMEQDREFIKFYLSEFIWTFINTKRCTSKQSKVQRSLYVYSSLGVSVIIMEQTTDLIFC
ncbi:hypothetical protein AWC38_SpisGene10975 [Stylophora pistillata]|uniref:Uncharacterized protein n=1 Tax=Stylophora pistillata TaxID=50429 RepID=A0A2B4S7I3_STYPI|nr:hypothetical protein AWC38_SpisGene10975 [Stylophora pistillata]